MMATTTEQFLDTAAEKLGYGGIEWDRKEGCFKGWCDDVHGLFVADTLEDIAAMAGLEAPAKTKPVLDYIVCTIDTNNFADDDPERYMASEYAVAVAEKHGWDTSETGVVHLEPAMIGQYFNANCARKRVRNAADWNGPDEWISCFVVTWEDLG